MAFIRGTSRPDHLNGTDNSDFIFGFAGDDIVNAGAGNDYVDGGLGNDHLDGGDGNDFLIGGFGNDILQGGRGNDVLVDSFIIAGFDFGLNVFPPKIGSVGRIPDDDVMNGGDGDDVLISRIGNDVMDGGNGNDIFLISGTGAKSVIGGAGNDMVHWWSLSAAPGDEAFLDLSGGDGDDTFLITGPASGVVSGGDGNDTLVVSGLFAGNLTFHGGAGDDLVLDQGGPPPEPREELPPGWSFLDGGDGNDILKAGAGDDLIDGGAGNDILNGGSGHDQLVGGLGSDVLTGGPGQDAFVFNTPGDGPDSMTDFTPGVDKIWIDGSGFGGALATGALSADQFVAGSDPVVPANLPVGTGVFLYDTDDGALAWDADGAGANAPVTIAVLINQAALSAADFLIV